MSKEKPGYSPDNPHPLSTRKTELVWEGEYDEYGNRREVDIAGCAMPMQKIETIDEPASRLNPLGLFYSEKVHKDDFRNMLIWGDNKLVMASLLKDFKGKIDLIYIDPPFDVGADLLLSLMPGSPVEQKDFFEPYYGSLKKGDVEWLKKYANNLKRTLIFKNGLWPSGLLLFCLEYNRTSKYNVGGVFEAIKQSFSKFNETDLYDTVKAMTDFRNTYVAHH